MIMHRGYIRELPYYRQKWDYGARIDGQPEYYGYVHSQYDEDSDKWVLLHYTYDASGFITDVLSLEGAWSGRVALFA